MCVALFQQEYCIFRNHVICSHWAKGLLGQAYIEENPLAALQAFAIASGWEQSSFMRHHFLGRALARRSYRVDLHAAICILHTRAYLH